MCLLLKVAVERLGEDCHISLLFIAFEREYSLSLCLAASGFLGQLASALNFLWSHFSWKQAQLCLGSSCP
jgi:hypothetical protein